MTTGLACGFLFFAGLQAGRTFAKAALPVRGQNNRRASYTAIETKGDESIEEVEIVENSAHYETLLFTFSSDVTLSIACGGASGFFVGTDAR